MYKGTCIAIVLNAMVVIVSIVNSTASTASQENAKTTSNKTNANGNRPERKLIGSLSTIKENSLSSNQTDLMLLVLDDEDHSDPIAPVLDKGDLQDLSDRKECGHIIEVKITSIFIKQSFKNTNVVEPKF